MKFFTNKKFLFKLIATLCVCLTFFNFCITPASQAESLVTKVGGKLLDPICALIVAIGDGMMEITQTTIMGTSATAIFDNTGEAWWKIALVAIIAVVGIVVATIVTGGAALGPILAKIGAVALTIGKWVLIDIVVTGGVITSVVASFSAEYFGDYVVFPTFTIGPEEIFSGKILLFDPNIFNPKELKSEEKTDADGEIVTIYYYEEDGKKIETSTNNAAQDLKETVAKWYYIIRNIAIIGLMLVLLYVGIRMLLTSIAADKAKYKQMLSDWVIALCLVFLMQYIMIFANSFVEGITKIFSSVSSTNMHVVTIDNAEQKLIDAVTELEDSETKYYYENDENGNTVNRIVWPTNMMGKIRFGTQQQDGTSAYIGYSICYFVLVLFTIFFTFTYLKRLLYLLFLTVIAPLVALTYPLDKIRDGQAQAFNTWVKEYSINLIIQPFHLLLYTVFISMAFELAGTNIIYSLVVLGFMIPAEKFLRNMFGFNRASSPGFLAGAAGAAMTISAVQSLAKFAGRGPGGKVPVGKGNSGDSKNKETSNIRSADSGNTAQSLMDAFVADGETNPTPERNSNAPTNSNQGENDNLPTGTTDSDDSSAEQRMLDAYDENYGTDEYDYSERETMARDIGNENQQSIYDGMSNQEKIRNLMENTGYSEEEAAGLLGIDLDSTRENREPPRIITSTNLQPPEQDSSAKEKLTAKKVFKQTGGYLGARAQNFASRNFNKKRIAEVAKSGLKKATTIGVGATAAGIGIAAGIATGSPGDTFKYAVSGAYAGSSIAQGTINRLGANAEKNKQIHEEALKKQYGEDEYERRKNKELDDKFKKDREMRRLYSMQFNNAKGKELDKIMEQAVEYRKYGITDNTKIIRAMSLATNPEERASNKYIAAAKLSQSAKDEKGLESVMKRLGKINGVKDKQKQEMENYIRMINKETLN